MKKIFSSLIVKRILAGMIDFLLLLMADKLLRFFSFEFSGLIFIYYIVYIYQKQSTIGGIILKIKTESSKGKKLMAGMSHAFRIKLAPMFSE